MALNLQTSEGTIESKLKDFGERIAEIRLSRNMKQAALAIEAGISLRSIKRLEAGENTSLETLIRVLTALGMGDFLLNAMPDPDVRPIERVRRKGHERQRARDKAVAPKTPWSWGEDAE